MAQYQPSLSNVERQEQILRFIEQQQRATVAQICNQFNISEATARRDLETLDSQRKVQRVHGGAIPMREAPPELPVLQRMSDQTDDKKRIGHAAAQLIQDGDTVFLGSGTTVLEVARNLRERRNLTIITNSLLVINALLDSPDITIISLGGLFRRNELSLIGHIAEQALSQVRADKVVIGIRALDVEHGLTNHYLPETQTDRSILDIGKQVIIVADHTKCARVTTAFLAPIEVVNVLVTDCETPADFVAELITRGIKVVQA